MISDLLKLPFGKATNFGMLILGGLIAPFWFLFQFHHSLYQNSELIKLLIICIAIGAPLLIFNYSTILIARYKELENLKREEKETQLIGYLVMAAFCNIMVLYIPCIASYINPMKIKEAIEVSIFVQIGATSYDIVKIIRGNKSEQKSIVNQPTEMKKDESSLEKSISNS